MREENLNEYDNDNDNDNNDLEKNFIEGTNELPRDSFIYEEEMKNFMVIHEGEQITNDIELLRSMGYNNTMINKVYILLSPESIERAIDYMTEVDGIIQHDFFENNYHAKDRNLCFICKKPRNCHLDYIPEEFLRDNDFDYNFNNKIDNDINIDNIVINKKKNYVCNVCFEDIDEEEKNYNDLKCGHLYCTQCWINYLKTLITEAKVEKIKCMEHKCKDIVPEEFILKHIEKDGKTVEKYQKFKKRAEIINNPNKKQCPKPDCDSFLQKPLTKLKYVKCENGHEYCFECLRPPHGKSSCEDILEKDFKMWSKGKVIKKCPKCKIYTEKNEGCNHMTCTSCKYQWCWLCEGEYKYGHYTQGLCNGHQFTKINYLSEIKEKPKPINSTAYSYIRPNPVYNYNYQRPPLRRRRKRTYFYGDEEQRNCDFSLSKIFRCCFHIVNYTPNDIDGFERLNALMIWFFGYFLFFAYQIYNNSWDAPFYSDGTKCAIFTLFGYVIAFFLFICYQVIFTCLITPFILISMIYPFFVYKIKMFFSIGKARYYGGINSYYDDYYY